MKVSPTKDVVRFGRHGKLNPHNIGPIEILKRVGEVAYRLALPPSLDGVHQVFHVSMLRKYVPDLSHIIDYELIKVQPNLTFEERPIQILNHKVQQFRIKSIPLIKLLWQHHSTEEAIWELENTMRKKYLHLFGEQSTLNQFQ